MKLPSPEAQTSLVAVTVLSHLALGFLKVKKMQTLSETLQLTRRGWSESLCRILNVCAKPALA